MPDHVRDPSVTQQIHRVMPGLTGSHQRVAQYVLAHPLQVSIMPIDELALAAGVSVATVNRFARAIGLDGYPALRAALVMGFERMLEPIEKMRLGLQAPTSVPGVFAAALEQAERNITATRDMLDPAACEAAVKALLKSRRIYIAGFGASAWLAGLLQRGLDMYCDNVHLVPGMSGASYGARLLARMTPQDLFVAIAYPRYLADTVLLAQHASEQNVPVLAITDTPQSPLVPHARNSLYARTETQYGPNADGPALVLIEALIGAVAYASRGSVYSIARMTESVLPWLYHDNGEDVRSQSRRVVRRRSKKTP